MDLIDKYMTNEAGFKWQKMLGGKKAKSGAYEIRVFPQSVGGNTDHGFEIWKGSTRVGKGKGRDQYDVETQARKALAQVKKNKGKTKKKRKSLPWD